MVDQGGWLDEVHWVENTSNKDDLAYLEEILAGNERFKKIDLKMEGIGFVGYSLAWEHVEKGNLYIKMDDDVVWHSSRQSMCLLMTLVRSGLPMTRSRAW